MPRYVRYTSGKFRGVHAEATLQEWLQLLASLLLWGSILAFIAEVVPFWACFWVFAAGLAITWAS